MVVQYKSSFAKYLYNNKKGREQRKKLKPIDLTRQTFYPSQKTVYMSFKKQIEQFEVLIELRIVKDHLVKYALKQYHKTKK